MSEETIVVEVGRKRVGDPAIDVFHVSITNAQGLSEETLGSRELLQKYLAGLRAGLRIGGWHAQLAWNLPETFHEPSILRWTLERGKLGELEELDSEGRLLQI